MSLRNKFIYTKMLVISNKGVFMKKLLVFVTLVLLSTSIFAQGSIENTTEQVDEKVNIVVGVPKAPPALPILRMIETGALDDVATLSYQEWVSPEQLIAMIQGSDANMFALPLTVVSKLYNKGINIQLTNVNTWGVIYFTTTDENFTTWSDLKGKTVYVPLKSSPPDYLTQYFIENTGLKIGEDVKVVYSTSSEIANLMIDGKIEYATMIEPMVTQVAMKNEKVRVVFSFEDLWMDIYGEETRLPNAGLGGRTDFIESNPELIARFESEYEKALNWVLENPKEAALLTEKEFNMNAKVIEKALPKMGLMYMNAQDSKPYLENFYNLLFSYNPVSIGGKIADSGMLYDKEI